MRMSDESSDDEQGECSTSSDGRGREKNSRGARVRGAGSEKGVRRGVRGRGGRVGRGRGRGGRGGIRVRGGGGGMAERRQARIRDEIYLEEKWGTTDQPFQISPFTAPAEIQVPIPPNAKTINFFNLFVVDEIMELISEQTNLYAEQYKDNNDEKSQFMRSKLWKPTNTDDIYNFLALHFLSGIVQKPEIALYWSTDSLLQTPAFNHVMSRNKYQSILQFLHFADNTEFDQRDPNRDKLFKVRKILDLFIEQFQTVYTPRTRTRAYLLMKNCFCSKAGSPSSNTFPVSVQGMESKSSVRVKI